MFMALFLGALEYVLEDGPRYDWFEDSTIATAAVISAGSAVIFFARVLMARQPIVDLRAFADRNFAVGSMFSFVLGIGLYGLTYLYPIYLGQIRGFNALMIGQTLFISGATMFLTAPLVGRLMTKVDARLMLAFGFAVVALSNWQMTWLTKDWEFGQLFVPQVLRGFGMMFAIVPITNISLGTLAPERLKNASGLFNLTRNLGGAVGLAGLNTVLDKRIDLHLARLHNSMTWARRPVVETLNNFAARIPGSDAQNMALKQLFLFVRQQATVLAFADVFLLLCLCSRSPGCVLMRRRPGRARRRRALTPVIGTRCSALARDSARNCPLVALAAGKPEPQLLLADRRRRMPEMRSANSSCRDGSLAQSDAARRNRQHAPRVR